jgi:hypothetical protein
VLVGCGRMLQRGWKLFLSRSNGGFRMYFDLLGTSGGGFPFPTNCERASGIFDDAELIWIL